MKLESKTVPSEQLSTYVCMYVHMHTWVYIRMRLINITRTWWWRYCSNVKDTEQLYKKRFPRMCEEIISRRLCLSRGTRDKKEAGVSSSVCAEVGNWRRYQHTFLCEVRNKMFFSVGGREALLGSSFEKCE